MQSTYTKRTQTYCFEQLYINMRYIRNSDSKSSGISPFRRALLVLKKVKHHEGNGFTTILDS